MSLDEVNNAGHTYEWVSRAGLHLIKWVFRSEGQWGWKQTCGWNLIKHDVHGLAGPANGARYGSRLPSILCPFTTCVHTCPRHARAHAHTHTDAPPCVPFAVVSATGVLFGNGLFNNTGDAFDDVLLDADVDTAVDVVEAAAVCPLNVRKIDGGVCNGVPVAIAANASIGTAESETKGDETGAHTTHQHHNSTQRGKRAHVNTHDAPNIRSVRTLVCSYVGVFVDLPD